MTLRTKIFLYFVVPVLISIIAISVYNSINSIKILRDFAEEDFMADTVIASKAIVKANTESGILVSTAAEALETFLFGKRKMSTDYMKNLLEKHRSHIGCSVSYEPNADGKDFLTLQYLKDVQLGKFPEKDSSIDTYNFAENKTQSSTSSWIENTENGRYLCYFERVINNIFVEPLIGTEYYEYYTGIKKNFAENKSTDLLVTEPYVYNNKTLMVEFAKPLIVKNKFVGEVAFDRDLGYIHSMLNSLKSYPESEFFLITKSGKIISSTRFPDSASMSIDDLFMDSHGEFVKSFLEDKKGKLLRNSEKAAHVDFAKLNPLYRDILRNIVNNSYNADELVPFNDSTKDTTYTLTHTSITPGNWILVQIVPENVLYTPLNRASASIAVELVVGILILGIMFFCAGIFTKKIKFASDTTEEIAHGNLTCEIETMPNTGDESNKLINAIHLLSVQIIKLLSEIKKSSDTLSDYSINTTTSAKEYENFVKSFDSSTIEIAHLIEQLKDNSKNVYATLVSLLNASFDAENMSQNGKNQLTQMQKSMQILSEKTQSVARRFALIEERIKGVALSLEAMKSISSEATLLSVNASIEAGKHSTNSVFKKIADNIASLSEQTSLQTKEIALTINDIRSIAEEGNTDLNEFSNDINSSKEELSLTIRDLDSSMKNIENVFPVLNKMQDDMSEQNLYVTRIQDSVSFLNKSAKKSAILLRQIDTMRETLDSTIQNIRSEISKFKTHE